MLTTEVACMGRTLCSQAAREGGAAGPGKESPEQPSRRRGHTAQPVTGSRQGAREKQVSTGAGSSQGVPS